MKQQERTGAGAWSTTLCSRTRLEYYMLSGIQVPLAMLNLFAKRHIESQRTADCGKDHVVGVLVLIMDPPEYLLGSYTSANHFGEDKIRAASRRLQTPTSRSGCCYVV